MIVATHPTERALADFVAGELPADETRRVVRHLLRGCAECQRVTSRLWPAAAKDLPAAQTELELHLERLRRHERRIVEERKRAEPLFEELEAQTPDRRLMLVANRRRYRSWFLAKLILDRVADLCFQDPSLALEYARLAVAVADRLPSSRYGEALVYDMRARSRGMLGNVLRINSDLVGAGAALDEAVELLENGTGDPLEEARLLGWRAIYLRARRQLKASARLFDRAIGICRRIEDPHQMGRMMVDKGTALSTQGDFEGAIRATREALELIDAESDPRLVLAARHNLALYLLQSGEVERSKAVLRKIRPLYARRNEPMVLLRLRWLEGRLAQAQGRLGLAEEAFREVQQGFIEREIPYEAAAVSFDLATILVEQRRYEELGRLAAEIFPIFHSLGIPRETLAALELFQRAVEAQRISGAWIAELAAYVEHSRAKPDLPFRPSA